MPTGATLYWTQREMELVLCISDLGRVMVVRTQVNGTWVGRIVSRTRFRVVFVEQTLGRKASWLVGCEELARFLQSTYYRRLTAYGIWKKRLSSRLAKSATGKKSKAVVGYGRTRRSIVNSRSPTGQ